MLSRALIPEFLAGIDYVLRRAEELKLREKLVVVVQSEMGRTPTYNGGNGKDHYEFERSTGLGGADHHGWGLFIEEGGDDGYQAKSGYGQSSEPSPDD